MKKLLAVTIVTLCAAVGAHGQDSQVVQLFACTLNDGKTVDNVWKVADGVREGWPKLDNSDASAAAFVWFPFRGATGYDYITGVTHSNLNSMVAWLDSYYSSGVGAPLDAEFAETGSCISAIMMSDQIRNGVIGNTGDRELDAVVETFGCTVNKGSDMDDFDDAAEYWVEQIADIGSEAADKYEAYKWTPYRGGTGQIDLLWVGNYPDFASWAQGESDYYTSKQGAAADERFEKVSTCTSSMWTGYWTVPPAGGPAAGD